MKEHFTVSRLISACFLNLRIFWEGGGFWKKCDFGALGVCFIEERKNKKNNKNCRRFKK